MATTLRGVVLIKRGGVARTSFSSAPHGVQSKRSLGGAIRIGG